MRDYQHYSSKQQLVVGSDMDVNEHERISTLRKDMDVNEHETI